MKRLAFGFSLTELLVTLVIVGIFTTAAIPGFSGLVRSGQRSAALNELTSALRLARAEAAKTRRQVVVCAARNLATEPACATGAAATDFEDGYIVFADDDRDGVRDAGERLIRSYTPDLGNATTLELTQSRRDAPRLANRRRMVVGFAHDGRLANQRRYLRESSEPRFVFCDDAGDDGARALYVTLSGSVLLAEDKDGNARDDYGNQAFGCPS